MALEKIANLRQRYAIFPLCLPGGSTIFGEGLPHLAMVKNPPILSGIQILIRITTRIYRNHLEAGPSLTFPVNFSQIRW